MSGNTVTPAAVPAALTSAARDYAAAKARTEKLTETLRAFPEWPALVAAAAEKGKGYSVARQILGYARPTESGTAMHAAVVRVNKFLRDERARFEREAILAANGGKMPEKSADERLADVEAAVRRAAGAGVDADTILAAVTRALEADATE